MKAATALRVTVQARKAFDRVEWVEKQGHLEVLQEDRRIIFRAIKRAVRLAAIQGNDRTTVYVNSREPEALEDVVRSMFPGYYVDWKEIDQTKAGRVYSINIAWA